MLIAPSMLSCDFANLGLETKRMEDIKADLIHIDVMDGLFVPNITLGPCVVKAMRNYSSLPFDVHLMIQNPIDYIDSFAISGADIISFHLESSSNVFQTIEKIKQNNVKPAIAIKPKTQAEEVFPFLKEIYMVLVMTVEPGFGGQTFMQDMMSKVKLIKDECKRQGLDVLVEVDGGINKSTAKVAKSNGVDVCVAGTSVFKSQNPEATVLDLRCEENT